jgi:spore photoproduct lyase
MIDPSSHIKRIYVDQKCADLPYTREILKRAPNIPVERLNDQRLLSLYDTPYPESLGAGKKDLLLTTNQGAFYKACPGTREYQCCDYQVLNIGMNCPMDCVYCILQAYLNNPWLSFFVNVEDLLAELAAKLDSGPQTFTRIGTGEFTDSLALDRLTGLSTILVPFMADKKNAVLELKTKSAVIANLEGLNHGGRSIVAWSLNAPEIMQKEELRTATLQERLAAAKTCAAWGYKLAFHFDPIIYHPGWREGYAHTIKQLFDTVPAEQIAWISMGALRYLPALKNIAGRRFTQSKFFHEEFVTGLDNKSRYFRGQRVELYKVILGELQKRAATNTCIYLCMESEEIWQEVFGFTPEAKGGLGKMLDRSGTNKN